MFTLNPIEQEALSLSLRVALTATSIGLPFAVMTAWLLAKKDFYGKLVFDGLIHLPMIIPPVVVGYLLLIAFGRNGAVGHWLYETFSIEFAFNWKGATLASGIMGFPFMVRGIRLSIEAINPRIETAARTLGASPIRVFFTISLPLMLPGLITGTFLGFARALAEFGATITFVAAIPGQTRTLPVAIYIALQKPGGEDAALQLVFLSAILAIGALAASELFARNIRRRIYGDS